MAWPPTLPPFPPPSPPTHTSPPYPHLLQPRRDRQLGRARRRRGGADCGGVPALQAQGGPHPRAHPPGRGGGGGGGGGRLEWLGCWAGMGARRTVQCACAAALAACMHSCLAGGCLAGGACHAGGPRILNGGTLGASTSRPPHPAAPTTHPAASASSKCWTSTPCWQA